MEPFFDFFNQEDQVHLWYNMHGKGNKLLKTHFPPFPEEHEFTVCTFVTQGYRQDCRK